MIVFASLLLFALETSAANQWVKLCKKYKYEQQGSDVFVGNPAKSYPHIHCEKNYIGFSHSPDDRKRLVKGKPYCNNINTAANSPYWYEDMMQPNMAKLLVKELGEYCQRMSILKHLLMNLQRLED